MPETKCREGFDNNINMLPIITPLLLHLGSAETKKSTLNIMSKFKFRLPQNVAAASGGCLLSSLSLSLSEKGLTSIKVC